MNKSIITKKNEILKTVVLLILFSISGLVEICSAQVGKGNKNLEATVIDTVGKSTTVTDLKARYSASYTIPPLERIEPNLFLVLRLKEGHTTYDEKVDIPFSAIKVLTFMERQDRVTGHAYYPKRIRIEKRNGSISLLTYSNSKFVYEELNAQGERTKTFEEIDGYFFSAGTSPFGNEIFFRGFQGRAKTKSGKEGEFFIEFDHVQSIIFK